MIKYLKMNFISLIIIGFANTESLSQPQKTIQMNIPVITKAFEKIDLEKFVKKTKEKAFLPDGSYTEFEPLSPGYGTRITLPNSYFIIVKNYYENGNIEEKGLIFNSGGFKKGIWYNFNEEGKMIREEDFDKPYKYSFEELMTYLQKQKIDLKVGPILEGFHTKIFKKDYENGHQWFIQWLKNTEKMPNIIEEITIDGYSGKIIKIGEIEYFNN